MLNFKHGRSFIDSPDWIKKKKAKINPNNKDDKCFQYVATVALNYEEIESHLEGVSYIRLIINKCNWKRINYPSKRDDWKTFENAYISKHNSTRE